MPLLLESLLATAPRYVLQCITIVNPITTVVTITFTVAVTVTFTFTVTVTVTHVHANGAARSAWLQN